MGGVRVPWVGLEYQTDYTRRYKLDQPLGEGGLEYLGEGGLEYLGEGGLKYQTDYTRQYKLDQP